MIKNSFILLNKISHQSEKNIWQQGIDEWDDFIGSKVKGISNPRKAHYDLALKTAKKELYNENSAHFRQMLPKGDHWRLYDFFKEDAVFLDIETSGYYGDITVIGIFDGYETKTMVRGFNLKKETLKNELSSYKILLTYNGASFDLPVIKRYFNLDINIPHIDLRFVCSRLGLTGGLKQVEKTLSIKRPEELTGISGADAVYLWNMWQSTKNKKYLDLLVQYNEEDIINLKPIADYAIKELWNRIRK